MTRRFISIAGLLFFIVIIPTSCREVAPYQVEKGVSKSLNDYRKQIISAISYQLSFNIPAEKSAPVTGEETLSFYLSENKKPLVIDFKETADKIKAMAVNGKEVKYRFENGHIIIPEKYLERGKNDITLDFIAGNLSLNRNDDYLYTLFVPDRASTAFPCFDQPDLKAVYLLTLDVPAGWTAVANGALKTIKEQNDRAVYSFSETKPLSTYLFAFVAGKFKYSTREKNGREITFYYRETDQKKIKKNIDRIFYLQFDALSWMENYTGIKYSFNKFAFVAIPSFQYSGMEHPGVVLYRAGKLFLDATATQNQMLDRASLISHETAHQWFGDLVTMDWFDDVWLKEVFANFMAAKIVNPAFPQIDHRQVFLIDHYPKAYAVDRTAGANAIRQKLDNLKQAGSLYGAIIYNKAPIVMLQLETLLGPDKLQKGLRQYLHTYAYSNADWDDLIGILDPMTGKDLKSWSNIWVKQPGMPFYKYSVKNDSMFIVQTDPNKQGRLWPQAMNITMFYGDSGKVFPVFADSKQIKLPLPAGSPDMILLNGSGQAYGYFQFTGADLNFLGSKKIFSLTARQRAIAYISVWENFQNRQINPQKTAADIELYLSNERNEQNINLLLKYYRTLFWRFSGNVQRETISKRVEKFLWEKMKNTQSRSLKSAYYKTFMKTAYNSETTALLLKLWNGTLKVKGLDLSEDDMTTLAYELAVRRGMKGNSFIPDSILDMQLARLSNPDKRKKMEFIIPALSTDDSIRDAFFESLKNPANREHEPWVLTALTYLNHPLRAVYSQKYILPSLNMLEEIQATGDIFFPKGWLDATLSGHNSIQAAGYVTLFLNNHPKLDPMLKQKVLQSADPVFRAAGMIKN